MTIELIKEDNAEVAATLPGSCWTVMIAEPVDAGSAASPNAVQFKALDVEATFTSVEKANRAANEILSKKEREVRGGRKFSLGQVNGTFSGAVFGNTEILLVTVNHETGQIVG